MTFSGPHDATHPGKVARVAQVFWSRKRCHHGEEVTLSVRTENIPDGEAVELRISQKGVGEIDTIGGLSLGNSKVDHRYTIDWKNRSLAEPREILFRAKIGKLVTGDSPVLLVDLAPPAMSA